MAQTRTDLTHGVQGTPELMVPAEAAEFLRISIGQLYHLTSERKVPFLKVGGQLRFEVQALLEHLRRPNEAAEGRRSGNKNAAKRGTNKVIRLDEEGSFRFKTPPRRR